MDRPLDAEPELRLALKEDPSNPPANYMLGRILLRNKKAQEALPFLQVAVNGDPTFMKGHLELGKCYLQLGEYPKALQALSKAAETDPQAPEPHVLLVQVYTRLKDDEKRTAELATVQKLERETQERQGSPAGQVSPRGVSRSFFPCRRGSSSGFKWQLGSDFHGNGVTAVRFE
jgi:predicted Zn-dependent protease